MIKYTLKYQIKKILTYITIFVLPYSQYSNPYIQYLKNKNTTKQLELPTSTELNKTSTPYVVN